MSSAPATRPEAPSAGEPSPPERPCPDCGHPAPLNYCPRCGQRQGPLHVSILELFHEWVEEFFHFDSKLLHTLGPLVRRPGLLTLEYVRGRRTRYLRPFRIWFAITITYFVLLALVPASAATSNVHVGRGDGRTHSSPTIGIQVNSDPTTSDANLGPWAKRLDAQAKRFTSKDRQTIGRLIQTTTAEDGPHLVLLLVPLFALLLKLFYWRAPLGEHFVFSFHFEAFHALIEMAVLLVECLPGVLERHPLLQVLPFLCLAVYLPLALRRVHAQRWLRTLWKSFALWMAYLCCWGALQAALVLITILRS